VMGDDTSSVLKVGAHVNVSKAVNMYVYGNVVRNKKSIKRPRIQFRVGPPELN